MPLRVIGYMHQQSTECRRQFLRPHAPRRLKFVRRKLPDSQRRVFQRRLQFCENVRTPRPRIHLRFQRRNLRRIQRLTLRIPQQSIQTSRDVPHVKRDRRQSRRPGVQFLIRQRATPSLQILARQRQRVQHPALHRRHIRQRPPQPWLRSILVGHARLQRHVTGLRCKSKSPLWTLRLLCFNRPRWRRCLPIHFLHRLSNLVNIHHWIRHCSADRRLTHLPCVRRRIFRRP